MTSAFVNGVALSALGFEDLLSDLWIARWRFRKRRHFSLSLFGSSTRGWESWSEKERFLRAKLKERERERERERVAEISRKEKNIREEVASNGELMFWLRFCWWVWVGYAGCGDDEVDGSVEAERVVEARETPVEVGNRERECFTEKWS